MRHIPLTIVQERVVESWSHRRQHEDFHALYVIEAGRGLHVIDSVPYSISRGDIYVMGPGSEHTWTECENLRGLTFLFSQEIVDPQSWETLGSIPGFNALVVDRGVSGRLHLDPAGYNEVARHIVELWSEWRSGAHSSTVLVPILFVRLLVRLARFAAGEKPPPLRSPNQPADRDELVTEAVRTIDLHYAGHIRVEELAADAHLSRDRFTEIFVELMGRSPRDYIRHVRLEHAKRLLTTTKLPIAVVGQSVGYRDPPTFVRAFRAATGGTPLDFRRRGQSIT